MTKDNGQRDVVSARIGVNLERAAVVKFLRREAADARHAQANAAPDHPDKLYRMGQKDGLLIAAEAIDRGHHVPRDSDRSGEAGETSTQIEGSTEGESAGRKAASPSRNSPHPGEQS